MSSSAPKRIKTIAEYHALRGYPKPEHPLISLVNISEAKYVADENLVLDLYSISLKHGLDGLLRYGQQDYRYDDGAMFFIAPGQVFRTEHQVKEQRRPSGWMLLIHPDFLWGSSLSTGIRNYEFFSYAVSEALCLMEKEEDIINGVVGNIRREYQAHIDRFSKQIIISQLESLLGYADRFYHRQFLTREKTHHQILEKLEGLLKDYFDSEDLIAKGLPTVQSVAAELNLSRDYLSSMLKALTGLNTQQHIHEKLIEKAKEKLSATGLSVSEIAYSLGFEHPQSFSKLFKAKMQLTPQKYRASFNRNLYSVLLH